MRNAHPAKEKLFKRARAGDSVALSDLLEGERGGLYDYLMRMTGQMTRSHDSVSEVFQSINEDVLANVGNYYELRLLLYSTARKFNADIWNAETSQLTNAALESSSESGGEGPVETASSERAVLRGVDRTLRAQPPREREVVLLWARAKFDYGEISEIMTISESEAERSNANALSRINAACSSANQDVETLLMHLPEHPMPTLSDHHTTNLSMVMQGLRAQPAGLWSPTRLIVLVLALAAVVVTIFWPDLWQRAWALMRAGFIEGGNPN